MQFRTATGEIVTVGMVTTAGKPLRGEATSKSGAVIMARDVEKALHGDVVEFAQERNVHNFNLKSNTEMMRELCPAVIVGDSSSSTSTPRAQKGTICYFESMQSWS